MNLVEKYRPKTLTDLVGQGSVVYQLQGFLEEPYPNAFVFHGGTGVGKTSAALAFAADLGIDVEQEEFGGLHAIASGEQTADTLRETLKKARVKPWSGSGWKMILVNEADRMSPAVQYLWLDALESIGPMTVIVFTTNKVDKLERRLTTRCEQFEFFDSVQLVGPDLQMRVNEVWLAETGRTDAPRIEDIPGAIEGKTVSIRAALQSLNSLVRASKIKPPAKRTEWTSERSPIDWDAIARDHRAGVDLHQLARQAKIVPSTLAAELIARGVALPRCLAMVE